VGRHEQGRRCVTERPPELQDLGAMFSVDVVEAIRRLVD
jgi:hypothetical protein